MAKKWLAWLVLAVLLPTAKVVAEDTFVLVFLEDAPLRHIKVAVDGKIVGVTDAKGLVQVDLVPGPHKLYLISDDNAIPVRFDLPENGQIEISAVFDRNSEIEPVVNSRIFTLDSTATAYIAGRVTSPSGVAVANAVVEVTDLGITTQTDEEGIYSLELPRGMHTLDVSQTGYLPANATEV